MTFIASEMAVVGLLCWFAFFAAVCAKSGTSKCNGSFYECDPAYGCFYGEVLELFPASLEAAAMACAHHRRNGKLPWLDSVIKQAYLSKAIHANFPCGAAFWLGLQRDEPKNDEDLSKDGWSNPAKWRWLGSENHTLASSPFYGGKQWKDGDPNGYRYLGLDKRCVIAFWVSYSGYYPILWTDEPCNLSLDLQKSVQGPVLICEADPATPTSPETASTTQLWYPKNTSHEDSSIATVSGTSGRTTDPAARQPSSRRPQTKWPWPWQWWFLGACALMTIIGLAAVVTVYVVTRRRRRRKQGEQRQQADRSDSERTINLSDSSRRGSQSMLADPHLDEGSPRKGKSRKMNTRKGSKLVRQKKSHIENGHQ